MDAQISRNGEVVGTCNFVELSGLVKAGRIEPTDYVWCEGWSEWKQVGTLVNSPKTEPKKIERPPPHDWHKDAATEKQINYLAAFGIKAPPSMTKSEASALIEKCTNDPKACKRRDKKREAEWTKSMEERDAHPSYYLRKEIADARKSLAEAEREIAECEDKSELPGLREDLKDAKEYLQDTIKERVTFWKCTFQEFPDEGGVAAMELYEQYACCFKTPTTKQIADILDALDKLSDDWDKVAPESFYGTYKDNFPGAVKTSARAASPSAYGSRRFKPKAKQESNGCLVLLAIAVVVYVVFKMHH